MHSTHNLHGLLKPTKSGGVVFSIVKNTTPKSGTLEIWLRSLKMKTLILCSLLALSSAYLHIISYFYDHDAASFERALNLRSSMLVFASQHLDTQRFHLCNLTTGQSDFYTPNQPVYNEELALSTIPLGIDGNASKMDLPVLCLLNTAKHLFAERHFTDQLLFVDPHLLITSPQLFALLKAPSNKQDLACLPGTNGGICNLNIYSMKVSSAMIIYQHIANMIDYRSAVDSWRVLFHQAVASRLTNLWLLPVHVVFAGQYHMDNRQPIAAIEFDQLYHSIEVNSTTCTVNIALQSAKYGTLPVIRTALQPIFDNQTLLNLFSRCTSDATPWINRRHVDFRSELERAPKPDENFDFLRTPFAPRKPRLVNCLLFNDELAQLKLRLAMYAGVVDHVIVVESSETFAHEPKPRYFAKYEQLFQGHGIIQIDLQALPVNSTAEEAEQYSWKGCLYGLQHLQVQPDDIILLTHADELPAVDALHKLREFMAYSSNKPRRATDLPMMFKLPLKYQWDGSQECLRRHPVQHSNPNRPLIDLPTALTLHACDLYFPNDVPHSNALVDRYGQCLVASRMHHPLLTNEPQFDDSHFGDLPDTSVLLPRSGYHMTKKWCMSAGIVSSVEDCQDTSAGAGVFSQQDWLVIRDEIKRWANP